MVVKETLCHNSSVLVPGRRAGAVASTLLLAAVLVLPGCYWLRYHDLVLTHAELIEDLSLATLPRLEESPGSLSPGDVERLRYPLERARQFVEITEKRYAGRESLAALRALVDGYAALLGELERVRVGAASADAAIARIHGVRAQAARVEAAVERERMGP